MVADMLSKKLRPMNAVAQDALGPKPTGIIGSPPITPTGSPSLKANNPQQSPLGRFAVGVAASGGIPQYAANVAASKYDPAGGRNYVAAELARAGVGAAGAGGFVPYMIGTKQPSAAPAPNPVSQPKPGSAGTGAAAASPMVPGMPQAGQAALNTPNDTQGRVAALDNQIRTLMQTRILNTPLGAPGREEVVNYVRQLKAEKDALARSTATGPNFLSPQDASAKQAQMIAVRRAELQRQLEATNQPNAPGSGAADAQQAGKMELWKRGMGEQVLRDKSGELQRMAGSQFDPGQYVSSGGAYGTPGEKAGFGRGVAQNAERVRLQEALAALDKEQGDLDSGKYASDYAGRQGQRDAASQRSQVNAAAARGEADRMKGQRELATAEQGDAATFEKRQREIALKMQEAQLKKMQTDSEVQGAMDKARPMIAQGQARTAMATEFYRGLGTTDLPTLRDSASKDWSSVIGPELGGPLTRENAVSTLQSVDPNRAQFWVNKYVNRLETMAATNPEEAKFAAQALLESMPYGGVNVQGNDAMAPESSMSEFTGIPLLVRLARMVPNDNAKRFAEILNGAYQRLNRIAGNS